MSRKTTATGYTTHEAANARTEPRWTPFTGGNVDFVNIAGQEAVKRAVMIAMAGKHSIALIGPPGWGKTMMIGAARVALVNAEDFNGKEYRTAADALADDADRFAEMVIEVPAVPFREFTAIRPGTSTARVMEFVNRTRNHAETGKGGMQLDDTCLMLMKQAVDELGLNGRSISTVCRIARTIANSEQSEFIQCQHIAEAVQYRLLDRGK